jgi:glutamyl-tRNA reductase
MGQGVADALSGHDVGSLVVVNRTSERSDALVRGLRDDLRATVQTRKLGALAHELASCDVLFTTVGTTHPLVDTAMLASALADAQAASPMVIVDLGMPRNVEPAGADLEGVELADMDDLRASVADALSGRREELSSAQAIVTEEVERYRIATRARDAAPVVSSLRSRVESVRQAELERRRQKVSGLTDAQWEEVDAATRAVVAKLLHDPTVALKEASGTPRGERLVEALRTLFDL